MSEKVYTKQEQVPATAEITEVAPNILRTQLPIDMPGLGHVNMYVLEDSRGVAVVDPGLPGKATWRAINSRLAEIGVPLKRVHSIIVTHSHPDHFGGAGRLRAETGADIITHESFRMFFDPTEPDDVDVETVAAAPRIPFGETPWGGPGHSLPWRRKMYYKGSSRFPTLFRAPKPTIRLAEGERISLAGREWMAIHTPGHTEDHLCLFDQEAGVMLCGDHVLPTITPHISGMSKNIDPLKGFFDSLDKVGATSHCPLTVCRSRILHCDATRSRNTTWADSTSCAWSQANSTSRLLSPNILATCFHLVRKAPWPTAKLTHTLNTCALPESLATRCVKEFANTVASTNQ